MNRFVHVFAWDEILLTSAHVVTCADMANIAATVESMLFIFHSSHMPVSEGPCSSLFAWHFLFAYRLKC